MSEPNNGGGRLLTVREAVMRGADFLARHGVRTPRLDSELLLADVMKTDRLHVYLDFDKPLSKEESDRARELFVRRGKHEPLAYIVGHKEFMGRDFSVGAGVLVPRPETELLVEWADELLPECFPDEAATAAWQIFELGCGSGCICVTLADVWPAAQVTTTDVSDRALAYTKKNAEKMGVADRLTLLKQGDLAGLPSGTFHAIVSNPPYVALSEKTSLMADVRDYEPAEALFAGADGLDVIRMILADGAALLRPNGFLLLEIGCDQGAAVAQLPTALTFVEVRRDYGGLDRMALWRKAD